MNKGRMEAFSDGVIAIIITIMVLELKVQHGAELTDLEPLLPVFISYVLSFVYVGIYWNNHHHIMQAASSVNGKILWANLHLLFWLSLIPFATAWLGENNFDKWPTILYGAILMMCSVAYNFLANQLIKCEGNNSLLAQALGDRKKENISTICYVAAIAVAFFNSYISFIFYVIVACIWFIPDKRVERIITGKRPEVE